MNRKRLQVIVASLIVGLWVIGLILSVFDGEEFAKGLTAPVAIVFGWLFTAKATET